jgi:hypothetical protein
MVRWQDTRAERQAILERVAALEQLGETLSAVLENMRADLHEFRLRMEIEQTEEDEN